MEQKRYKIRYTYSSRNDIKEKKQYILDTFKYRGLAQRFTDKILGFTVSVQEAAEAGKF